LRSSQMLPRFAMRWELKPRVRVHPCHASQNPSFAVTVQNLAQQLRKRHEGATPPAAAHLHHLRGSGINGPPHSSHTVAAITPARRVTNARCLSHACDTRSANAHGVVRSGAVRAAWNCNNMRTHPGQRLRRGELKGGKKSGEERQHGIAIHAPQMRLRNTAGQDHLSFCQSWPRRRP
jgi:hypothetical protein